MALSEPQLFELLQAVDLSQVAVTATVDASGHLGKIEQFWEKLKAAVDTAATNGELHIIVVSADQEGVPAERLLPDSTPVRVLKAATLHEVVRKLYDEYGPRQAIRQWERQQCANLELIDQTVPIDSLYQVLPLLHEVKRLPRERADRPDRRDRPDGRSEEREAQDEPAGLRAADILRWEEQVRGEDVTYERVRWSRCSAISARR